MSALRIIWLFYCMSSYFYGYCVCFQYRPTCSQILDIAIYSCVMRILTLHLHVYVYMKHAFVSECTCAFFCVCGVCVSACISERMYVHVCVCVCICVTSVCRPYRI